MTAWRDEMSRSHAWLVRDGWLVDVTADQFLEVCDPVIVVQDSEWHDSWENPQTSRRNVGLNYYDPTVGADQDYEQLRALIAQLNASD